MARRSLVRTITALGIFAAGVATGLATGLGASTATQPPTGAAPATDSPQRVEQKRTDLTGARGMEVIASVAEYKPGEGIGLHIHHGVEVAYVLQGARVQSPGKDPVLLATGATAINLRDAKHAGFVVVGEAPLKLFTVHVVDRGKPLYDYTK